MINKQSRLAISMMGERPEKYDWVTGEILVERYGQSHPHFLLKQNDRVLAKIDWPFARRGNYTSTDGSVDLDLVVSQMGRTLVAKDLMSHMSTLHVKRTMNRKHSKLMICLSDSDCFLIKPQIDRTKPWPVTLGPTLHRPASSMRLHSESAPRAAGKELQKQAPVRQDGEPRKSQSAIEAV